MSASTELREIESDIEQTRRRLDATLGALQRRLSPGEILDQGISYLRSSGSPEFFRNLGRSVRDNPLPVVLVGAGIAWLMLSERRSEEDGPARPLHDPTAYPPPGAYGTGSPYAGEEDLVARAEAAAAVERRPDESLEAYQERVDEARARALGLQREHEETSHGFRSRIEQAMTEARERYHRMQASAAAMAQQAGRTG